MDRGRDNGITDCNRPPASAAHFFSLEESRMHVHVQSADGEVKIWLEPTVEVARTYGLSEQDVNRVLALVREREQEVRDAWNEHFSV